MATGWVSCQNKSGMAKNCWLVLSRTKSLYAPTNILLIFILDSGDMMFEQLEMDSREVSTHQKRIKLDSNKYQLVYGYHDHVTHNI